MKCRAYNDPNPDKRAILDCVSNFIDAINRSLRAGTVRNTKFTDEFCTAVFKLLFGGKGEVARKGRGQLYQQPDFDSEFFTTGWHQCWDRLGDGCQVVFPIQIHSHVKFSPPCYFLDNTGSPVVKNRFFNEVVSVSVVKQRC